jgi:hypothetical protein
VRDPSPNASASPSLTTTRCTECADPALGGRWPWAPGAPSTNGSSGCFRGARRRALVVAYRDRGRPLLDSAATNKARNAAAQGAEAERRALGTGSTARPGALDFRCGVAGERATALPCRPGRCPRPTGVSAAKTGKPAKPRSELCREDAEPPRSTPSASDRTLVAGVERFPPCSGGRSFAGLVARRAGGPDLVERMWENERVSALCARKIGETARRRRRSAWPCWPSLCVSDHDPLGRRPGRAP